MKDPVQTTKASGSTWAAVSKYRLLASLLLGLAAGPVHHAVAIPLVYEGFQYIPGQTLPTMAGGTGWGGIWIGSSQMVDQPPTLNYAYGLLPTGDALLNPAAGEAYRPFAAPFNNTMNDLWISFQEETLAAASSASAVLQVSSASITDISLNKDGLGALSLNGIPAGFSAGVGNVDLFVLQLAQFGGGTTLINLFVDPGPVLGPPSASLVVPSVVSLNQFYYISDPNQMLDEIRVGTTLQDVATVAVPEPGSFTLLAAALLLLPFAARPKSSTSRHRLGSE